MIYYQIIAHNPAGQIDEICSSHIYPSYLTCYSVFNKKTQNERKQYMLQSNPHDGLKFTSENTAKLWMTEAQTTFPKKEFEVIAFDSRFYGRITPRWIIN